MTETLQNYINGAWCVGASGETFENENPAERGSVLNRAQASTAEDVDAAIGAAAEAFKSWSRTSVAERQAAVSRFLDALAAGREELAKIVSLENGKTINESRGEVDSALLEGRHHLQQMSLFAGESAPRAEGDVTAWEQLHPLGVIGVISPWNYPMNVMCRKTLPALLTGNTVVFKPASFTPWSAVFMAGLFEKAGVPAGVFNCVTGRGSALGNQLIKDPRVLVHGIHGGRAQDPGDGGGGLHADAARAGRQERDDRAGGCRPGCRRGGDDQGRVRLLRTVVHLHQPRAAGAGDCRCVPGEASRAL